MPKRKFQPAEILVIRASLEPSGKLADKLGVSASTICKIRNGWIYKKVQHVPFIMGVRPSQENVST